MSNIITVRALCKICMQEQFHDQKYNENKVPMWTSAIERAISNRLRRELSAGEVLYKVKSAIVEKGQPMPKHAFVQDEILTTYDSDSLTCYCWVFLPPHSSPTSSKQPEKKSPSVASHPIITVAPQPVVELQEEESAPEEAEVMEDDELSTAQEPNSEAEQVSEEEEEEEGSSFWFNPLSVVPVVTIPTIAIDPNPLSWFSSGMATTTNAAEPSTHSPSSQPNSIITMITTALELDQQPTENIEMEQEVTTESNQSEPTSTSDESKEKNRPKGKTKPVWDIRTAETIASAVSVKRGQFVLASGSADDNDDDPSPATVLEKKPAKKWPTVQTGASRAVPQNLPTPQNNAIGSSQTNAAAENAATSSPTSITAEEKAGQAVVAVAANVTADLASVTEADKGVEERTGGKGMTAPPSPPLSTVSEQESNYFVTESDWLKPTPSSASAAAVVSKQPPSSTGYYAGLLPPGHSLGSPLPTGGSLTNKHFAAITSPAAPGEQWPPRPITELYPAHTLSHPYDLYEHSLLHPSETNASANASARASPTYLQPFQLQHTVLPPSGLPAVYANPAYENLQTSYQSHHPSSNQPPIHATYDYRPLSTSAPSLGMPPLPPVPLKTTRSCMYHNPYPIANYSIHLPSSVSTRCKLYY